MHSSTPAAAPSRAAEATASPFPNASPHTTDEATITVQITDMATDHAPFLLSIYTRWPRRPCPAYTYLSFYDKNVNLASFSPIIPVFSLTKLYNVL